MNEPAGGDLHVGENESLGYFLFPQDTEQERELHIPVHMVDHLVDAVRCQLFRPNLHIFRPVHELSGNGPGPAVKGGREKQ